MRSETVCYREEIVIKQIDISYFLTVLLSIPFYKLPWSRPEKKSFSSQRFLSIIAWSILLRWSASAFSLLLAGSIPGLSEPEVPGCHGIPRFWQINQLYSSQGGQLMPTTLLHDHQDFSDLLPRPCILTIEPSDLRQCSERFQVEMIAVCAINN